MSLNLAVPANKDSAAAGGGGTGGKERSKTRRTKSPKPRSGHGHQGPRAKSKSPNPSFCSVLSRVKDWELGAFTPKTALADNVDVMCRSNVPFSDSDSGGRSPASEAWKPSPTGSPMPPDKADGVGGGGGGGGGQGEDKEEGSQLTKTALDSSNLGEEIAYC